MDMNESRLPYQNKLIIVLHKKWPIFKDLRTIRTSFVQFCIVFFLHGPYSNRFVPIRIFEFLFFFHLKSLINISLTLGVIAIRNRLLLYSLHS